jgi:nucleoside-diphosphate-sugar epimerase
MKILVTGGAGYIGSVLVPYLIKSGHEVKVVDLLWFSYFLPENCEVIKGDRRRPKPSWFKGADAVIHLAAIANDPSAEMFLASNYEINAMGTALVAHAAKEQGVKRFILGSTCSVYGFTTEGVSKEGDTPAPKYPYGISKLMAELADFSLADNNFSVLVFRQGTVGGPSPKMRYDLVVNTMTKSAIQDKKIIVKNSSLWRPVVDIRDVARAYELALKQEIWVNGIFNIVQGNYTILQLGTIVAAAVKDGGFEAEVESYDRFDLRNYKASSEMAMDKLGFQAEYSIRDTVSSLLGAITEGLIADFDNPNYYNIEVCKNIKGLR